MVGNDYLSESSNEHPVVPLALALPFYPGSPFTRQPAIPIPSMALLWT